MFVRFFPSTTPTRLCQATRDRQATTNRLELLQRALQTRHANDREAPSRHQDSGTTAQRRQRKERVRGQVRSCRACQGDCVDQGAFGGQAGRTQTRPWRCRDFSQRTRPEVGVATSLFFQPNLTHFEFYSNSIAAAVEDTKVKDAKIDALGRTITELQTKLADALQEKDDSKVPFLLLLFLLDFI